MIVAVIMIYEYYECFWMEVLEYKVDIYKN